MWGVGCCYSQQEMKGLGNVGKNGLKEVKMGPKESNITNSLKVSESKTREIVSAKTINHQKIQILMTVNINKTTIHWKVLENT